MWWEALATTNKALYIAMFRVSVLVYGSTSNFTAILLADVKGLVHDNGIIMWVCAESVIIIMMHVAEVLFDCREYM